MVAILSILTLLGVLMFDKDQQDSTPCEVIEAQMASGFLHHGYFKVYREKKGSYPESLNVFYSFLRSSEAGYDSDQISLFEKQIIDPYTKKEYVYFPLKMDGKIVDYVMYSLGPDKQDDNIEKLQAFNNGNKPNIIFTCFPIDCKEYPLDKAKGKADIVVRVPGVTYGKQFEIDFVEMN